jgi:hypothetical protein
MLGADYLPVADGVGLSIVLVVEVVIVVGGQYTIAAYN